MRPLARTFVFNLLGVTVGLARLMPKGVDNDRDAVERTPHPDSVKAHRWISVLVPPVFLLFWMTCGWDTLRGLPTLLWFRLLYVAFASAAGVLAWLSARGEWRRWQGEKALASKPSTLETPVVAKAATPEAETVQITRR